MFPQLLTYENTSKRDFSATVLIIRGRRIPVSFIAVNADKWSIAELAYDFTISEEEVLAALLYYREYKEEIDRQDAEEDRLWHEMAERSDNK